MWSDRFRAPPRRQGRLDMNRKKHENVSDFVDNVAGGQTHKVSDGAYTGYGSSRSLADRAYEEAKKTNREYVAYGVDPKEDMLGIWNHYGSTREQNHEPNKDEP